MEKRHVTLKLYQTAPEGTVFLLCAKVGSPTVRNVMRIRTYINSISESWVEVKLIKYESMIMKSQRFSLGKYLFETIWLSKHFYEIQKIITSSHYMILIKLIQHNKTNLTRSNLTIAVNIVSDLGL